MDSDTTDLLKISVGLCAFSSNGLYIAVGNQQRLNVYPAFNSAKVLQVFTCSEPIQFLEWSTDSELLITAYPSKGKLEIWCILRPDWRCKISLGREGLHSAFFAPESRHIITVSDLHLRLTIWSLTDCSIRHINLPKEANPGVDFSPGGSFMAVVERKRGKEIVGIYSCTTWTLCTVIEPDCIEVAGIQWSPDSSRIAVWSELYPSKTFIYGISGSKLAVFDQDCYSTNRQVLWSPSSQVVAICTSRNTVQLINHLTWGLISTFSTYSKLYDTECTVYEEKTGSLAEFEVITTRPLSLMESSPKGIYTGARKKLPYIAFSADSQYLAVLDEVNQKIVWIWDVLKLSLKSILIHKETIKCFKWGPRDPRLAVCCGTPLLYFWTPLGSAVMNLKRKALTSLTKRAERHFPVEHVDWNISGQSLLICGRDTACLFSFEKENQLQ